MDNHLVFNFVSGFNIPVIVKDFFDGFFDVNLLRMDLQPFVFSELNDL